MNRASSALRGAVKGVPPFPLAVLVASVLIVAVVAIAEDLQTGLLQVVLLLLGVWSSYALGHRDDVRGQARTAYRRMSSLHAQLFELSKRMAAERDVVAGLAPARGQARAEQALDHFGFAVGQSLVVIAAAMDDWKDVAPTPEERAPYAEGAPSEDYEVLGEGEVINEGETFIVDEEEL